MKAITVNDITKTYLKGTVLALDKVSLEVNEGELFGLIGPDGAGKSTLFRILTTLLLPDSGQATVAGYEIQQEFKQIRSVLGYMPVKFSLYQDLTIEENLNFFATVFDTTIEENYNLIKDIYVQLEPFKTRKAGKLSGGMKQKLALCCALIHKPKVLFLDEPTTGVDVVSRKEFWEMLKRLKAEGITIMVSTSYMDEANLCDRIGLMLDGKILSVDSPGATVAAYPEPLFAIKSERMYNLLNDLRSLPYITQCYTFGEFIHIAINNEVSPETTLLPHLHEKGHQHLVFGPTQPTVEDCFIRLLNSTNKNHSNDN